jgi:hypothetical protein
MATELQTFNSPTRQNTDHADTEGNNDRETLIQTLPSPDRGQEAYKFLFAAFIVEGFLWGEPAAPHQRPHLSLFTARLLEERKD